MQLLTKPLLVFVTWYFFFFLTSLQKNKSGREEILYLKIFKTLRMGFTLLGSNIFPVNGNVSFSHTPPGGRIKRRCMAPEVSSSER